MIQPDLRKIVTHRRFYLLPMGLLILITWGVYANSLSNVLLEGDKVLLANLDLMRSWRHLPFLFTHDYFRQFQIKLPYQPVTTLSYLIDYSLWGSSPWGYHLTNLLLHLLNTVLLYGIVLYGTRRPGLAFLTGVLFALHPIHTESINAIAFRDDLLACLFFLLALTCYLRAGFDMTRKMFSRQFLYGTSLIFYFLSLLSKEVALSLPLVILLTDLCLFSAAGTSLFQGVRRQIGAYGGFWLISAIYLGWRFFLLPHSLEGLWPATPGNLGVHGLNAFKLGAAYLKLLLLPVNLSVYHPFPLSTSLGEPWVLASIGIIAGLLAVSLLGFRSRPELSWGILWILITLLPITGLAATEGAQLAERLAYLPSVGFCFLATAWLAQGTQARHRPGKGLALALLLLLPLFYAQETFRRNFAWQDDVSLWQDAVQKSPSLMAYLNLGDSHLQRGMWDSAIQSYENASKIDPHSVLAWKQLGNVYLKKGDMARGVKTLEQALEIAPQDREASSSLERAYSQAFGGDRAQQHLWRGDLYEQEGAHDRAISEFQEALKATPDQPEALNRLGVALARKGELEAAIQQFQRLLEIRPQNSHALNNLGMAYQELGKRDEAIRYYEEVLRHDPTYAPAHLNLGIIYLDQDRARALHHLRESLRHNPRLPQKKAVEEAIRRLASLEGK